IGLAEAGLPPSSLRMQPNNIEVEQARLIVFRSWGECSSDGERSERNSRPGCGQTGGLARANGGVACGKHG
ncbi:MAG: hypothetical protein AAFY56_22915, partial [Pseudomonadota bacterium]